MHQGLGRHLCYFCNSASGKGKALSRFTAWLLSTTKLNPLQSKDTSCLCKGRMGYFCVKGNVLMKQGRSTGNKFVSTCKALHGWRQQGSDLLPTSAQHTLTAGQKFVGLLSFVSLEKYRRWSHEVQGTVESWNGLCWMRPLKII